MNTDTRKIIMKTFVVILAVSSLIVIVLKWADSNDKTRNSYFESQIEECRSRGANFDFTREGCVDVTNE